MTDSKELVARLRGEHLGDGCAGGVRIQRGKPCEKCGATENDRCGIVDVQVAKSQSEAADLIEAQAAEIERLNAEFNKHLQAAIAKQGQVDLLTKRAEATEAEVVRLAAQLARMKEALKEIKNMPQNILKPTMGGEPLNEASYSGMQFAAGACSAIARRALEE